MANVLIVDEAVFMRHSIRLMLEKNGIKVAGEAENGQVALTKYTELQPDLVTMDVTMPIMDGVQAVKAIVAKYPNAKIIMVSAMGQEKLVCESILSGAKGFVIKPFKEEVLISSLKKLM